jgi:hypothetical protein
MGFKDYDAMLAETISGAPSFKVAGQNFTCKKKLPWKRFQKLLLSLTVGQVTEENIEADNERFFSLVLRPECRDSFLELINYEGDDEEKSIDSKQVSAILDDLLEYYTGKAPKNESDSTDSRPSAGAPSNVTSLTPREGVV